MESVNYKCKVQILNAKCKWWWILMGFFSFNQTVIPWQCFFYLGHVDPPVLGRHPWRPRLLLGWAGRRAEIGSLYSVLCKAVVYCNANLPLPCGRFVSSKAVGLGPWSTWRVRYIISLIYCWIYLIYIYLITTCWTTRFMGGGLPARSSAVDLESSNSDLWAIRTIQMQWSINFWSIIVTYRICNEISSHLLAFLLPPGDKSRSRCSSNLRLRQKWLQLKMIAHLSASE